GDHEPERFVARRTLEELRELRSERVAGPEAEIDQRGAAEEEDERDQGLVVHADVPRKWSSIANGSATRGRHARGGNLRTTTARRQLPCRGRFATRIDRGTALVRGTWFLQSSQRRHRRRGCRRRGRTRRSRRRCCATTGHALTDSDA